MTQEPEIRRGPVYRGGPSVELPREMFPAAYEGLPEGTKIYKEDVGWTVDVPPQARCSCQFARRNRRWVQVAWCREHKLEAEREAK